MTRKRSRRISWTFLLGGVLALLLASGAQAVTLTKDGANRLVWNSTSTGATQNDLTISYSEPLLCLPGRNCDPSYSFRDTAEGTFVVNGIGCSPVGDVAAGDSVTCDASAANPVAGLVVSTQAGNDSLVTDPCILIVCSRLDPDIPVPMTITGGDGGDTLSGSLNDDTINGGNGSDTLFGEGGGDTLIGGNDTGADTLNGQGGNDSLSSGPGNDTLVGGLGDDGSLDGGGDNDTVSYNDGRATGVTVTLGDGGTQNDGGPDDGAAGSREAAVNVESITGSQAADTLIGDGDFNTIDGQGGDDTIRGGALQDDLNGGAGTDLVDYSDHATAVIVTLDASNAFKNGTPPENDATSTFEAVLGTSGNDILVDGYPAGNPTRLDGAAGNDTLTGGASDDTMIGGTGSDAMNGQGGNDTVLYAGAEGVSVTLNDGAAKNDGGPSDGPAGARDNVAAENVSGGDGDDSLIGDPGVNTLQGGTGNDTIQGGLGTDNLSGGAGRDLVSYEERASSQPVTVSLDGQLNDGAPGENDAFAADFEIVAGGAGADTLSATGVPGAEIRGNSGEDALFAPNGGGTMLGGAGNDSITGGDGNDVLDGGLGDDAIDGLGGTDQFFGREGSDSLEARDGVADAVDCGADTDTALTDDVDVRTDCELPAPPAQPSGGGGGGDSGGGVPVAGSAGVDVDRDGFFSSQDCNDNNPAIRPNAEERPGNDLDENCDGRAAPFPRLTSPLNSGWSVRGRRVTITRLVAREVPANGSVEFRCDGKGCPVKKKKAGKPKKGQVDVLKAIKKQAKKFRAGQTLEVRITAPGRIGKVVRFTLKPGKIPSGQGLCLPPGASRPGPCN